MPTTLRDLALSIVVQFPENPIRHCCTAAMDIKNVNALSLVGCVVTVCVVCSLRYVDIIAGCDDRALTSDNSIPRLRHLPERVASP